MDRAYGVTRLCRNPCSYLFNEIHQKGRTRFRPSGGTQ